MRYQKRRSIRTLYSTKWYNFATNSLDGLVLLLCFSQKNCWLTTPLFLQSYRTINSFQCLASVFVQFQVKWCPSIAYCLVNLVASSPTLASVSLLGKNTNCTTLELHCACPMFYFHTLAIVCFFSCVKQWNYIRFRERSDRFWACLFGPKSINF